MKKEENKETPIVVDRITEWWRIKKEYDDEINKEVEYRIAKIKAEEEKKKELEEHKLKYPIGSFINYLGITMMVKANVFFSAYNHLYDMPYILAEWVDRLKRIQTKQFGKDQFQYIKQVDRPIDTSSFFESKPIDPEDFLVERKEQ